MAELGQTDLVAYLTASGGVSRTADLDGPVHYVDFGGPADGPAVLLVHGLGGSHLNWCRLAPLLAGSARVLAVDLVGFGLTHPDGRSAAVPANAALLGRFLREVVGEPAVLVGNSMGGMVSIMAAAARPDQVTGLVLIDPALPLQPGVRPDRLVAATFLAYAVPGVGERYLARRRSRLSARELVQQVVDLCCVDPTVIPADLIGASVALVEERAAVPGLDTAFLTAARSLLAVGAHRHRYWAAMRAVRCPVLLLQGQQDRLVSVRVAREAARRNPEWRYREFPDVGHVPQLEAPDAVAAAMLDWLDAARVPAPRRGAP